jgi:predicted secreted protein
MRAFAVAVLLLAAACTRAVQPSDEVSPSAAGGAAASYTDADSAIQVRVGAEFVITLPSNPSTGYRWMLADSLGPMLRLQAQTYVAQQPVMPGSGGHERLTFVGVAAGETTIRLRYQRPVQASAPRRAEFRVRILPAAR